MNTRVKAKHQRLVLLIIALQMANTAASSMALKSDNGWPALYIVPLAGIFAAMLLMWVSQRPRRRRREVAA